MKITNSSGKDIKTYFGILYMAVVVFSYLMCFIYSTDLFYLIRENFWYSLLVFVPLFFIKGKMTLKMHILLVKFIIIYVAVMSWIFINAVSPYPKVDLVVYEKNIELLVGHMTSASRNSHCYISNDKYRIVVTGYCDLEKKEFSIILKESKHKVYKSIFLCDIKHDDCYDLKTTKIKDIMINR